MKRNFSRRTAFARCRDFIWIIRTFSGPTARNISVSYCPGEADSGLFGGNSNWRGPVWFPLNFILLESLEKYHHFYGDSLKVECPVGSGNMLTLQQAADELGTRLIGTFLPDKNGRRPCHGDDPRFADDPHWKELLLFHEYFHGETGRGCGASHQTGWTSLVAQFDSGTGTEAGSQAHGHAGTSTIHAEMHEHE